MKTGRTCHAPRRRHLRAGATRTGRATSTLFCLTSSGQRVVWGAVGGLVRVHSEQKRRGKGGIRPPGGIFRSRRSAPRKAACGGGFRKQVGPPPSEGGRPAAPNGGGTG